MGFNPKDAIEAARDIATHAVERSADIVENAAQILKGNVSEGATNIVQDSLDIATHSVKKAKEMATGRDDDEKVEEIAAGRDDDEVLPDEEQPSP